jgi:hypothetical protein
MSTDLELLRRYVEEGSEMNDMGITKKSEMVCHAITVPWEGFMLKTDKGAVMALEPDLLEP